MEKASAIATDFILGIVLNLRTVIQINIISFYAGKRNTGIGKITMFRMMK